METPFIPTSAGAPSREEIEVYLVRDRVVCLVFEVLRRREKTSLFRSSSCVSVHTWEAMDTPQPQTAMSNSGSSEAGAQHQEPLPLPTRARSEITAAQETSAIPQGDKVDLLGARREEILQTEALIAKEKKEALLYNLMIANDKAKDFGDAMIASDLEAIENSDGMFVLRDIPALELKGYKKVSIVVRKVTQEFWQRCIDRADATDEDCRVVVLGTPGIGKTTSTPLLIRHLLKRGTTVVYHENTPRPRVVLSLRSYC
jgi:hypothetical protein